MTILAMVNAEKEGQIESKLMKARQMEEIREAKRKEAEARHEQKKSKLVRQSCHLAICWIWYFVNDFHRKRPRTPYAGRSARATVTWDPTNRRKPRVTVQNRRESGRVFPLLKYCIIPPTGSIFYVSMLGFGVRLACTLCFISSQKRHICRYHERERGFHQKSRRVEVLYNNDIRSIKVQLCPCSLPACGA